MTQQVNVNFGPVLRDIAALRSQLSQQIDGVGTEVGRVRGDLQLTSQELHALRAEFEAFVQQTARIANVQQSETRIVNLRAELDREFGHYSVVRRTSVGLLQAFDVGNVSNETATAISEELMLQTPRYWLAPALVALAAWSRDNEEMATRSVQEAFARDKNKTSLFFALVLRRQGRLDGAVRWLRHYLTSLDPSALTREFAVILEATSYRGFGTKGQQILSDLVATWCAELRSRPDIVEAQVQKWYAELAVHSRQVDQDHYATLAALCPEWPAVQAQLERAAALPEVIEKYAGIKDFDAPIPSVLEDMLDDMLDQLVTEYDDEELPLKRDVVYHESVIEEGGDLVRARAKADLLQEAMQETTDVVTLQTSAAINPGGLGVGVQTQRIAIGVGVADFRQAVGRYCRDYRASAVDTVRYQFGDSHSQYASTYGFQGCAIQSSTREEDGEGALRETWEITLQAYLEKISFKNKWYLVPSLIAAGVTVVAFLISPIAGIVAALVAAGVVWLLGAQAKKKAQAAVTDVERAREAAIEHSISLYRDANAQLVDALLEFRELDEQEAPLLHLIDTWPGAAPQKELVS